MNVIKDITELVIYEDVDGVKTAHSRNPAYTEFLLKRLPIWIEILIQSETNSALYEMVEKAEVIYFLSRKNDV